MKTIRLFAWILGTALAIFGIVSTCGTILLFMTNSDYHNLSAIKRFIDLFIAASPSILGLAILQSLIKQPKRIKQ